MMMTMIVVIVLVFFVFLMYFSHHVSCVFFLISYEPYDMPNAFFQLHV